MELSRAAIGGISSVWWLVIIGEELTVEGRFAGSPTVLVNGQDLFPGCATVTELTCRLYLCRRLARGGQRAVASRRCGRTVGSRVP